jgi:hypothetical protein
MITTSENVNINKVIRLGTVTEYTTDTVSIFIKHDNVQKRFTATTVLNSTLSANGLIEFTNIPLWGDGGYSFYITAENNSDLDVNGVGLSRLATGYIKKITNETTIVV